MKNLDVQGKIKKPSFARLWFKKALKHIAVGAVSLGVVAGAVFGFVGCAKTNTSNPTPQPEDPPIVKPIPGDEDTYKNVDFGEFLENHKEEGVTFFNKFVKPSLTAEKDVLAESINFDATQDNFALDHVSYAYVYKNGDTARKYDVVDVQLSAPIKFDDILNNEVKQSDVVSVAQTSLSFDFDAKVNVEKAALSDAIYGRMCKLSNTLDANANTYFGKVTPGSSFGYEISTYNILSESKNKLNVNTVTFFNKNLDENQFIESLKDDTKFNNIYYDAVETETTTLRGENIFKTEYKAEFGKENDEPTKPDKDKNIENAEDLVTNYSAELNQGLQGAYDNIVEQYLSRLSNFNASKLSETKWNLDADANGSISKINYVGKFDNRVYFVISASLKTPINIKGLTNKNVVSEIQKALNGATYNFDVRFNYDKESMSQFPTLAKAVFEKEGLKEEGATYYISSWEGAQDETLGRYQATKILQVSKSGVKQISIRIKEDGGLVNNVNAGKYTTSNKTSYNFGEYTINAETNKATKTSLSLYNEETGKYNIEDFGDEMLF